ncbi:MAG: adenylate/guanylate cyclase domain-containing protein [Bacteroidota bacterium]
MKSALLSFAMLWQVVGAMAQHANIREDRLKYQYGFEKLENYGWLAAHYLDRDLKKAHRFARQGDQLARNLLRSEGALDVSQTAQLMSFKQVYGQVAYHRGKYVDAREAFEEALRYDPKTDKITATLAVHYLKKIDSLASIGEVKENPLKQAFKGIDLGAAITNSKTDVGITTSLEIAKIAEKRGDTAVAIAQYQKAANLLQNSRSFNDAAIVEQKVAALRAQPDLVTLDLPDYDTVVASGVVPLQTAPAELVLEEQIDKILIGKKEVDTGGESIKFRSDYYQAYLSLQTKAQEDSLLQVVLIEQARGEMERLQQENEIADLNIEAIRMEKQAEAQQKRALLYIALSIVIGLMVILFLYITKRQKHKNLTTAYEELHRAKQSLEEAEGRLAKMLKQQVSPEIASALIEEETERKQQWVTVMFLDIRDFTPMASKMEPAELIDYQNRVFGFMIEIIDAHHGNINQFMGDGFMATFGAPKSHGNDAQHAVDAARNILEELHIRCERGDIPRTIVGIGLHSGYVVTGNVGTEHRKQFSVTGETVIIAARVEQLNKPYDTRLIMTSEVAAALASYDEEEYEPLSVTVKGREEPISILLLKSTTKVINA